MGHFDRAQPIFKILPVSGAETMFTNRSRSFQRGALDLCRSMSCKFTVCQTLLDSPIIQDSNPGCTHLVQIRLSGWIFSNLQLWKLVTLQHFDLQRPTVPLWKGLELVVNILAQETARILKISFTLLKWPNLHRVYFIRV